MAQFDDIFIPTYIINLKDRLDRRQHIEQEFKGKPEFELLFVDAVQHKIGAVGLWESMVNAVKMAIDRDDDIIIICEDDHIFTPAYSKAYLLSNLIEADSQGVDLLSGGIGGFGFAVPVAANRYWVDWFWCTQFIVVFKSLFERIVAYEFKDADTADGVLSALTMNKMTVYPFLSSQKDFGYSDVTRSNNEVSGMITKHFANADHRLGAVHWVTRKYNKQYNK